MGFHDRSSRLVKCRSEITSGKTVMTCKVHLLRWHVDPHVGGQDSCQKRKDRKDTSPGRCLAVSIGRVLDSDLNPKWSEMIRNKTQEWVGCHREQISSHRGLIAFAQCQAPIGTPWWLKKDRFPPNMTSYFCNMLEIGVNYDMNPWLIGDCWRLLQGGVPWGP